MAWPEHACHAAHACVHVGFATPVFCPPSEVRLVKVNLQQSVFFRRKTKLCIGTFDLCVRACVCVCVHVSGCVNVGWWKRCSEIRVCAPPPPPLPPPRMRRPVIGPLPLLSGPVRRLHLSRAANELQPPALTAQEAAACTARARRPSLTAGSVRVVCTVRSRQTDRKAAAQLHYCLIWSHSLISTILKWLKIIVNISNLIMKLLVFGSRRRV